MYCSVWESTDHKGNGRHHTWARRGIIPWEVDWQEALHYAQDFYTELTGYRGPISSLTGSNSRLAATLVAWSKEPDVNGNFSQIKSAIFISSIPRGFSNDRSSGMVNFGAQTVATLGGGNIVIGGRLGK